jgi:hypothetical protein
MASGVGEARASNNASTDFRAWEREMRQADTPEGGSHGASGPWEGRGWWLRWIEYFAVSDCTFPW